LVALLTAACTHQRNECESTNTACRGGAVAISDSSFLVQGNASFDHNNAFAGYGGAISLVSSLLTLGPDRIVFTGNSAGEGSALHLGGSDTSALVINPPTPTSVYSAPAGAICFAGNSALLKGGTVAWIAAPSAPSEGFFSPSTPFYNRTQFADNTAAFGVVAATTATSLQPSPDSPAIIHLAEFETVVKPHPSFTLLDAYGQTNVSDSTSVVTATVAVSNCFYAGSARHIGTVSGATTVAFENGRAVFHNLTVGCYPRGNLTLQFTAYPSGLSKSVYKLVATQTLVFRACVAGEILINNVCQKCADGYLLQYATGVISCTPCPEYAR
jgi:hypothetical protein